MKYTSMKKNICYIMMCFMITSYMSGCSAEKQTESSTASNEQISEAIEQEKSGDASFKIDEEAPLEETQIDLNAEIQVVEKNVLEIQNELQNASTQLDMNVISAKEYQLWDDELNSLWSRFCSKASENLKASVLEEQRVWIKTKESKVALAGAQFEGGSIQPLIESTKAAQLTRIRCYELAGYLADAIGESFTLEVPKLESLHFVDCQGTTDIYSELTIEETNGMEYIVSIGIYRLGELTGNASMQDANTYEFEDTALDIKGIIHLWDDATHATFEVTESGWEMIEAGEIFEFTERT